MGIQSFVPASGGGTPGFDFVASIKMDTLARTWARSGTAGLYALTSLSGKSGYVYFRGSGVSTGTPLNNVVQVDHSFTSIDIVGFKDDYISLNKASVKSTTALASPQSMYNDWYSNSKTTRYVLTFASTSTFTLPSYAIPLYDYMIVGAGGSTGGHSAGGGGGGGIAINLLYPYSSPVTVTVGTGTTNYSRTARSGDSSWGSATTVYGGGNGASHHNGEGQGAQGGNGGGGGGHSGHANVAGGSGLSIVGAGTYYGGNSGGNNFNGSGHWRRGGGGGGALGSGTSGDGGGAGGLALVSDFAGAPYAYAGGGGGSAHDTGQTNGAPGGVYGNFGHGAGGDSARNGPVRGADGVGIARFYA
jgi:hypothetical protein